MQILSAFEFVTMESGAASAQSGAASAKSGAAGAQRVLTMTSFLFRNGNVFGV